jgi:uncharacterized membrane protein (UPF0127 family)
MKNDMTFGFFNFKQYGDIVKDGRTLFSVRIANTWWSRLRGLLAYPPLQSGEALLLCPCSAVHGVGIGYPLDLAFVDRQGKILKCCPLHRWSMAMHSGAYAVLEMPRGSIEHYALQPGQLIEVLS